MRCCIVLPPLAEPGRRRLFAAAATLCIVPVLLAPLAGRSSFEMQAEREVFERRFVAAPASANAINTPVVSRDPFIAQTSETESAHVATATASKAAQGTAVVRAIVSGPSPRALVEEGGRVRIVADGDVVSGARVISIDETGVLLSNGTVLTLEGRTQ